MKKIIEIYNKNKWIDYVLIIIIGLIMCVPLIETQIIAYTHDGFFHLARIIGTMDSLEIGQFPPLVAPNFFMGSGYGINLFYAPMATYVPLLLSILTHDYIIGMKIFSAICIVMAGIFMYQFTHQVTKKRQMALFAGIIYTIVPYKLRECLYTLCNRRMYCIRFYSYSFYGII